MTKSNPAISRYATPLGTGRQYVGCLGLFHGALWLSLRSARVPTVQLLLLLGLMLAGRATAQTFASLHVFTAANLNAAFVTTNSDGVNPWGHMISGKTAYGTTDSGGSGGNGTLFKVNTDGTGFTTLHSFTGGSDGAFPLGLVLSGNILYGTAAFGGSGDNGLVFSLNTNGTGFTTLHSFTTVIHTNSLGWYTNSDGAAPRDHIILSGTTIYGTTDNGGMGGSGTLFKVNTSGMGFTTLHNFSPLARNARGVITNSDGHVTFNFFLEHRASVWVICVTRSGFESLLTG